MTLGRTLVLVIVVAAVTLAADPAFAVCAMCRRALASPEGQQMMAAFRSGILLLLVAPFAAFAAVATLAVRDQKRRNAAVYRLPNGESADARAKKPSVVLDRRDRLSAPE